ncbi:cbb3-type cytochrome oxidase assembly protein CcoS [Fulvivirga sp. M361]|uniref:cbb3-type cytochrome oxidase assembly protein CcoS n=1 Tax=Fulvivirga sp. M361 TaxID=2594266 RepID=UPI00117B7B48|nr:cbb3-type cytochrome oxidase assembly protein CcoS [Fulvivirga sp. M361]TRX52658.1 cbb3-type cytochrome oxidase assembly protein CcoS [Fulvivirga sp. M361]
MAVIFVLILVSMTVAGGFLGLFIWATKSGQFDDTVTPSMRMLFDNKSSKGKTGESNIKK